MADDGGAVIIVVLILLLMFSFSSSSFGLGIYSKSKTNNSSMSGRSPSNVVTPVTRGSSSTQSQQDIQKQLIEGAPEDAPETPNMLTSVLNSLITPNVIAAIGIQIGISTFISKIDARVSGKVEASLTRSALNSIANGTEKVAQKLGMKTLAKSAERLAVKTAVKSTAKLTASAAAGPLEVAEMAFQVISGAMDGMNLGGFKNLKSMDMLNEMRDTFDKYFVEGVGLSKIPLVYGPFDKLSSDELKRNFATRMVDSMKSDPKKSNETEDQYIDRKIDEIFNSYCTELKGTPMKHPKTQNNMCSFKQTECKAPWPLESGDTYYEWKDGVCQVRPSQMKSTCEGLKFGVTYNEGTGSCNLTREYCGRYAGSAVLDNGDCTISDGQEIAELLFGTTITRSIVNIFDFKNNYKACPPGTSEPYELIGVGLGPMAAQYLCGGSRCHPDEEMMMQTDAGGGRKLGGLCYPKCKQGYSSRWGNDSSSKLAGMCYQDCPPGFDPSAAFCTRLAQTRASKQQTASCPSGFRATVEGPGGICQSGGSNLTYPARKVCKEGWSWDGSFTCYENCPSGYYDDGLFCRKAVAFGEVKAKRSERPQYVCDRPGYFYDGAASCTAQARPLMDIGTCPAGWEKSGGMCYEPCSVFGPEWKRTTTGLCQLGNISRERDSYSREPTSAAYSVFPKERVTAFPSTSQDDFKNSTIGKYIQQGINSVRDGNIKGLAQAAAGFAMVANPATLSLGASDMADLAYQKSGAMDAAGAIGSTTQKILA